MKQTFKDSLAIAESVMTQNAGRGTASFYIAGVEVCAILSTLPGWVKLYDSTQVSGAHLFGTLDGVPVIRVPITATLATNKMIIGFKGNMFDAPAVYSPYMPLTVTSAVPAPNILVSKRAAAVWAGLDVLVKNFITSFEVIV